MHLLVMLKFDVLFLIPIRYIENSDIDTKDIYIYIMMNNYGYFQRV